MCELGEAVARLPSLMFMGFENWKTQCPCSHSEVAPRTPVSLTTGEDVSMKTSRGAGGPQGTSTLRKRRDRSLPF